MCVYNRKPYSPYVYNKILKRKETFDPVKVEREPYTGMFVPTTSSSSALPLKGIGSRLKILKPVLLRLSFQSQLLLAEWFYLRLEIFLLPVFKSCRQNMNVDRNRKSCQIKYFCHRHKLRTIFQMYNMLLRVRRKQHQMINNGRGTGIIIVTYLIWYSVINC